MAGSLFGVPAAFKLWATTPPKLFANVVNEVTDAPVVEMDEPAGKTASRDRDGLFHVGMKINGRVLTCLVDTGASSITLSSRQADKLGAHGSALRVGRVSTAAGTFPARRADLQTVELAGYRFERVSAVVVLGAPTPCLLGMEVLTRLDAVEIQGDQLAIR